MKTPLTGVKTQKGREKDPSAKPMAGCNCDQTVIENGKEITKIVNTLQYVPASPQFTAVITVTAQRRSPESQALVVILEEMDISIVRPKEVK